MDKLKMHSPDLVATHIERLAELFPGCVTESRDEQGALQRRIDFDLLRQELSDRLVEGPQERYRLDWPGKREALLAANAPIAKTLRPCREESVDFDTTQNLFIEGDNLEALKLLQETYLGKVKMIYIDPPYNTGNDFVYCDDFSETAGDYLIRSYERDEMGARLVANTDSNGRFHSAWLSMIYSRLRLARNLLSDDGAIFISIDDNEVHTLRRLCDEVFGDANFVAQIVWMARQFTDARAKTGVSTDHEYIVIYAKQKSLFSFRGVKRDESKFCNKDRDPRGAWMSRSILGLATKEQRPNLHYDIVHPTTGEIFSANPSTGWRYSEDRMLQLIREGRILFPEKEGGRPREKKFRSDMQTDFIPFRSVITDVHTADGTQELRSILGSNGFPFPKPASLLATLVAQATSGNDIVLDFFAGSGATFDGVMKCNSLDDGRRRCISVQIAESLEGSSELARDGIHTIADLCKERLRRTGTRLQQSGAIDSEVDVGFRVLKIATSNMADVYYRPDQLQQADLLGMVDNIRPDRSAEDLLFQVLLDWGVDLGLPIRREDIAGREVYFVDGDALAACFVADGSIDEAFVRELAQRKPVRIVFRDRGFANDNARINAEQIVKALSPGTDVRTL